MKILLTYIIVIVVVVGVGFLLFQTSNNQENLPAIGQEIESLGAEHITDGSFEHPEYNSNPPTSGWHWPSPAPCTAYDTPQPDERLIHNLEHGTIWISYKPDIDVQTIAQLEDFVRRFNNVLVSPRPSNDSNIAVAAWMRLLKLEEYDDSQIASFIRAYADKGPERVGCTPGVMNR